MVTKDILWLDVSFLNDDTLFEKYYHNLSPYRKAKTDRYRHRKDKNLSVGAGILLGNFLQPFGKQEKDMQYRFSENGKPFFCDFDRYFSISHSKKMVAVSFSERETGCDIQYCDGKDNKKIAQRFFTSYEYDTVVSSQNLSETFYRIWTVKESYLKLTGQGIGNGLNFFEVRFQNNHAELFRGGKKVPVDIKEYRHKNYWIAVCEFKSYHP
ncbi:MAG: 4'-phosphopantetheinyl transferase superfamily protein [Clostridia bacterium]|nr:4'-phosphopantetheinyl transferase superfamily protein [Clostridia bacterium]